jgi:hypothetical protein
VRILAAPTFLNLRADAWAAVAAWVTLTISLAAAVFVYHQLREARLLREEQSRPFVIVDVAFRSIVVDLVVRNIGATAATNVIVFFDEPVTSSRSNGVEWPTTPLFTTGMPLMAPGRIIRFLLDTFPGRETAGLPMTLRGQVSYRSPGPRPRTYTDTFDINLEVYRQSLIPEKGLPELIKEVEILRKEVEKWTDGTRGLHVRATDRDRGTVRELRSIHLQQSIREGREHGWHRMIVYWIDVWLRRLGWRW